jgi:hypothetical protein
LPDAQKAQEVRMSKQAVLAEFLDTHAKNRDLVPKAMEALEPFFLITKKRKGYALARAVNGRWLAKDIALAIGGRVQRVAFISPRIRSRRKERAKAGEAEHPERIVMKRSQGIHKFLAKAHLTSLEEVLGLEILSQLWKVLRASLTDDLENQLGEWAMFRKGTTYGLRAEPEFAAWFPILPDIVDNHPHPIFYFLAAALAGDEERMGQLEPLMSWLTHCVPLGRGQIGNIHRWLVLSA